jgi:hypothetical protein
MRSLSVMTYLLVLSQAVSVHATANGKIRDPFDATQARIPLTPNALASKNITYKKKTYTKNYLSLQNYNELRDGVLQVLSQFPAKKYFYVPIGRSPTAVAAFLEHLAAEGTELSITVPASGLRKGETTGLEQAWFAHLDKFIPASVLTGKQKILLIDRSTTGASLTKAKAIFEQYLAQKGSSTKVEVVAFSRKQVPFTYIDVTNNDELFHMNRDAYVPFAEWPSYEVGVTPVAQLKKQPSYQQFKQLLLQRMQRDTQLSQTLHEMNLVGEAADQ